MYRSLEVIVASHNNISLLQYVSKLDLDYKNRFLSCGNFFPKLDFYLLQMQILFLTKFYSGSWPKLFVLYTFLLRLCRWDLTWTIVGNFTSFLFRVLLSFYVELYWDFEFVIERVRIGKGWLNLRGFPYLKCFFQH